VKPARVPLNDFRIHMHPSRLFLPGFLVFWTALFSPLAALHAQDEDAAVSRMPACRLTILSDITLIQSPIGDSDCVNILTNRQFGRFALNYLANQLASRGDTITTVNLSTIGLLSLNRLYRVISSHEEEELPIHHLEFQKPPFFVDNAFRGDTLAVPLLRSVFTSLLAGQQYGSIAHSTIPAAKILGETLGGNVLCIVFVRGYDIGVAGEYGSDPVGASAATSIIGVRKASDYSVSIFFIDGTTGTVIGNGTAHKSGGALNEDKLTDMLDSALGEVP